MGQTADTFIRLNRLPEHLRPHPGVGPPLASLTAGGPPNRENSTFDSQLARYTTEVRAVGDIGRVPRVGADTMSGTDKAKNKAEDLGGKAKERVGTVTGKDAEDAPEK